VRPRRPTAIRLLASARVLAMVLAMALAMTLAMTLVLPPASPALEFREMGVGIFVHSDIDIKGGNLGGMGLTLGTAAPLWNSAGPSHDFRLDLRLEAEAAGFWNYATGMEVSLLPGLRFYLPPLGRLEVRPFLEGGLGPSWNNLHIHELGSGFNFLSYGGLGLRLPLGRCSLDLDYRLRHISNAGLDENNHGVTSHLFQLALAWDF
jgi:hypothetical protein